MNLQGFFVLFCFNLLQLLTSRLSPLWLLLNVADDILCLRPLPGESPLTGNFSLTVRLSELRAFNNKFYKKFGGILAFFKEEGH